MALYCHSFVFHKDWGEIMATASTGWYCSCSASITSSTDTTATITVTSYWQNDGWNYDINNVSSWVYCGSSSHQVMSSGSVDTTSSNTARQSLGSYSFIINKTTSSQSVSCYAKITSNSSYVSGTKTSSTVSVTVPAKTSYTVSYNTNGGSGATSSQTKWHGTTLTLSSTKPTRTGYTFSKWNTKSDGSGTSYSSGASYTSNSTVTLYAIWIENKLTVNYYSNYADYGTYKGEALNVSASTNIKVHSQDFLYDNSYSSALSNVQNADYLYLSRTGYTPTGYWGTSTSGGTLIDEDADYSTGQALAQAFGKSLASGNASVNVYPQWKINTYTISYNANGGSGSMNSQTVSWNNDFVISDNLFKREGCKFIGWNAHRDKDNTWYVIGQGWLTEDEINTNGYEKKVYENQAELTFNNSWISGDEYSISEYTMYAVWEISGVIYIHNGISFEPYLAYIDNGTSWDLYLAYIDNGTEWNIVS